MARDDTSTDGRRAIDWFRRRGILKAVGAGAAVSVGSGYALGSQQEGEEDDDENGADEVTTAADRGCQVCLDRVTGYTGLSVGESIPDVFDPDHIVEMRIADVGVLSTGQVLQDGGLGDAGMGGGDNATDTGNQTAGGNETTAGNVTTDGNETADGNVTEGNATAAGNETEASPGDGGQQAGAGGGQPEFFFDPVGLRVSPGDIVEFRSTSPEEPEALDGGPPVEHTVTAYHPRHGGRVQRIPGDTPYSSGPIYPDEYWLYEFRRPGVHDILCLPHEQFGMVMRVVVVPDDGDVPPAPRSPTEADRQLPDLATQVFESAALDPENVVDQGEVAWADLRDGDADQTGDDGATNETDGDQEETGREAEEGTPTPTPEEG